MKSIPFKRCEGDGAELVKALSAFVRHNYQGSLNFSESDFKAVDAGLDEVRLLRNRVISVCKGLDSSPDVALESLQTYYGILTEFEQRFPFGSFKTSMFSKHTPAVMVEWKWTDAFRPVKYSASYNIKLERAAVLFNVGAAFSLSAASCDRSNDDGTKKAAQLFLRASGVFQYMMDNPGDFSQGTSQDLTTVTFTWLKDFMFAQACAATFESAVLKKMSSSTIAMLATGAADQYDKCKAMITPNTPLGIWLSKSEYRWYEQIEYQSLCFKAAAQFWQAKTDIKESNYGLEIGRLQYAVKLAKLSEKYEPNFRSLQDARKKLVDAINVRLVAAVKDNDSIYYQIVPKDDAIPRIEPKVLGKIVEFTTPPASLAKIFEKLIPVEIQIAADEFKEQMSKLLTVVSREANESTDLARASLASMNLPASLEAVETNNQLPKNLEASISNIQISGGSGILRETRREVRESAQGCYSLFDQITLLLEGEIQKEKEMRKKYSIRWNRNTSEEVGAEYHRELNSARKFLQQAQLADSKVDKSLESAESLFKLIEKPVRDIAQTIPSSNSALKSPESDRVRAQLDVLSSLLHNRETMLKKFEEDLKNCEIVDLLVKAGKGSNFDRVKTKESDKFTEYKLGIESNISEQGSVFSALNQANEAFLASKTNSDELKRKEKVLRDLNIAVDTWNKLYKELNQGRKFYLDLLANCLQPLILNVQGFCSARETEASILSEELESQSRSFSGPPEYKNYESSAPSAPDFEYPSWGSK